MADPLLTTIVEKGLFAAIGLIFTMILSAIGLHAKQDREFRAMVHKKIDKQNQILNEKIDHNHEILNRNFPDNKDFKLMLELMNTRFDNIQADIKDVRDRI